MKPTEYLTITERPNTSITVMSDSRGPLIVASDGPGACWFDHHGGCQEHGYLDLKPGELCPHAEAKQLLGDEPNGR